MVVTLQTKRIRGGQMEAISSKSYVHRYLFAAMLAGSQTQLKSNILSVDMLATIGCIRALKEEIPCFDCKESGSTARFLLPVAAALKEEFTMVGCGNLPNRPFAPICNAMRENGVEVSGDFLPIHVKGRLKSGTYRLPGNVSSQYITGLLFALPILDGDSEVRLTTKLESKAYIDITLAVLHRFGIKIEEREQGYFIPGNQSYRSPGVLQAEGDWSNAAFYLCMGALGDGITMTGLDVKDWQGDKAVLDILKEFGAAVSTEGDSVTVQPGVLNGIRRDVSEIPDLVPVLCVVAGFAEGVTCFTHAERLRMKESDRIETTKALLAPFGISLTAEEACDGSVTLYIEAKENLSDLEGEILVDGSNDHRIVMSGATIALASGKRVSISDAQAVNKSYPGFFEDYGRLFADADVLIE